MNAARKTLDGDEGIRSRARMELVIGVDIDGTIADQVTGLAGWLHERHGLALTVEQVTQWDHPIGDTDFGVEIELAYRTREDILLEMPPIDGAIEAVRQLSGLGRVIAITSRPHAAHDATIRWIEAHGFAICEFTFGESGRKSQVKADVLIDDYPANVEEFVEAGGIGLLVARPWNRAARFSKSLERSGRLLRAESIAHTPTVVRRALRRFHPKA